MNWFCVVQMAICVAYIVHMKENKDISKNFVLIEPKSSDEEVLNLLELARMI